LGVAPLVANFVYFKTVKLLGPQWEPFPIAASLVVVVVVFVCLFVARFAWK
jgi:hypothetical protein